MNSKKLGQTRMIRRYFDEPNKNQSCLAPLIDGGHPRVATM